MGYIKTVCLGLRLYTGEKIKTYIKYYQPDTKVSTKESECKIKEAIKNE